ncbi:MAG: phosphoribosylformylglycinamidine cyclo-ligase [Phycisphaerales bacterium]|jgi:phosphoribosylformylglycinamidine cyclo-ligase|nr:phosphoribosylformylglycinamidine cyclo-ligase [Phycisphaerales bacterium]
MAKRTTSTAPRRSASARPPAAESPRGGLSYASAGIDLERYDSFTASLPSMMRRTFGPRVIDNPDGFAGLFRLDYNEKLFKRNFKDPVLVACCDGVGTKLMIARDMERYDTVGIDLVAMNVNDLIVQGAEPLIFLDYVAVHHVEKPMMSAIVKGIADGCERAGCALLGGETAEMTDMYRPGDFDLAGFAVGVVELKRAVGPSLVSPGDIVLGLASSGVHSNGYSLVRQVVGAAKLDLSRVYPELDPARTLGEVLLEPTRIYAEPIVRLQRRYAVKKVITGMAHITGGGMEGNLCRALPGNCDAVIDESSWDRPAIFDFLAGHGDVAHDEMRKVFNMGIGYCVIVRPTFADSVREQLEKLGETVFTIGKIVKGKGEVRYK